MSHTCALLIAAVLAGCGLLAHRAIMHTAWVSNDGLRFVPAVGTCGADHDPDVEETAGEVRLTIWYSDDHVQNDCGDGVTVTLGKPLDDRVAIDTTTAAVVEVLPRSG